MPFEEIHFTLAVVYSSEKRALRIAIENKDDKFFTSLKEAWGSLGQLVFDILQSKPPFQLSDLSHAATAKK